MVIAESKELAEEAARLVEIEYEDLEAILTIEVNTFVLSLFLDKERIDSHI